MGYRIRIPAVVDQFLETLTPDLKFEVEQQIRLLSTNPGLGRYVNFPYTPQFALHVFDFEVPTSDGTRFFRLTYNRDLERQIISVRALIFRAPETT